jgi:Raf kinase inhibitor-like YbhB/YbcL family protein
MMARRGWAVGHPPIGAGRAYDHAVASGIRRFVVGALVVGALASCGQEADEQRDAAIGGRFNIASPAFEEGGDIPDEHALAGGNTSPPLEWSGVPDDAEELALTVVDPDASNFVHWVVWGIDPGSVGLEAGADEATVDGIAGLNQFGDPGWGGPAPPAGEEHTYVVTLHALSRSPRLAPDTPAIEAVAAIDEVTTETAELRGQFSS